MRTHVQYVLLAYPRYCALAESKPLGITCQWMLIRTNNVQLPGYLREDTKIRDQSMEFDLMDRFFSGGNKANTMEISLDMEPRTDGTHPSAIAATVAS
jgi:hypothetical protein